MLERFTDGAREVVYLAIEEANERGHDCVGVEHVLLGLLGEQDGVAARVLCSLGVTVERVRARLSGFVPPSAAGPWSQDPFPLPFTPQAKRVLERGLREALTYGSRFVGTEHILLGLVGEHENLPVQVLLDFDVDVDVAKIRNAIPAPLPGRLAVAGEPGGALVARVPRIRAGEPPLRGPRQLARGGWRGEHSARAASSFRPVGAESEIVARASLQRVFARVNLQSSWRTEIDGQSKRIMVLSGNSEHLSVHVSLSAELGDSRRISTTGRDFGISGPRRGIWHRWHGPPLPKDPELADRLMIEGHRVDEHDIEDGINQMLGRDPQLHHPPRLAWGNLIAALAEVGLHATERDLIETPLVVEVTPEVQAELEQP